MIRVYIEMLPGGEALRKSTIARFDVWNRSNLAPVSDYAFAGEVVDMHGAVKRKTGAIIGHERADGVLELVRRLMVEAGTDPRVSVEERMEDLSAHLLMLCMTVESSTKDPQVLAVAAKAREALARSGK